MEEEIVTIKGTQDKSGKNKKVIFVAIVVILAIIIIGGLGGYLWYMDSQKTTTVEVTPTPTVEPVTTQAMTGTVTDKISEEPLSGVTITAGTQSVKTKADGTYSLTGLSSTDKVSVTLDGYLTMSVTPETTNIALTPKGTVVFVSNRDGGKRNVYSVNYDGTGDKALTTRSEDSENYSPVISPRERYVAYLSTKEDRKNRYGTYEPNLFLVKTDGTGNTKISDFFSIQNINWSPDGTYVAWIGREHDEDSFDKAAIRDISSGKTVYFGETGDSMGGFAFSNDDKKVVFGVGGSGKDRTGIWLADGNGDNPKRIATSGYSPSFDKDGNVIFYQSVNNTSKRMLWNAKTNATKEIEKEENQKNTLPSPDKLKVAYIDTRDGKTNVFIAKSDLKDEVKLTDVDTARFPVRWTLDGKYLTFGVTKTGESARYIVAASGKGKAKKIVDEYQQGYEGYY